MHQICNSYLSATFVTPVTCPLAYIPINMALDGVPQIVDGALYFTKNVNVRIAPSAVNKQPWRIIISKDKVVALFLKLDGTFK